MTSNHGHKRRQTLIIGAGPSGLGAAQVLGARGLGYVLVDRHRSVGGVWDSANRGSALYDAARLITSREMTEFPNFPLTETSLDYPDRTSALRYLARFAEAVGAKDHFVGGKEVRSTVWEPGTGWKVRFTDGDVERFDAVISATGSEWVPHWAEFRNIGGAEILHGQEYWSPEGISGARVLVVGGGNSASDIAIDCSKTAAFTGIAFGDGKWFVPSYVDGLPSDLPAKRPARVPQRMWGRFEQAKLSHDLAPIMARALTLGLPRPSRPALARPPIVSTRLLDAIADRKVAYLPIHGKGPIDLESIGHGAGGPFDYVISATGYAQTIPGPTEPVRFRSREFTLGTFSRRLPNFFMVGGINSELGGFWVSHLQAQLVGALLALQESSPRRADERYSQIITMQTELSGGAYYSHSPWRPMSVHGPTFLLQADRVGSLLGVDLEMPPRWHDVIFC